MEQPQKEGLLSQLRNLIHDTLEYLNSLLTLQQARFTAFALSGVLFILQISFAVILALAAFILFNIAIGIGLAHLLGNNLYAVAILGGAYAIIALLLSFKALRWLKKLKS
jgi:hypothetical protein